MAENWRWNVMRHPRPTQATIVVSEPSVEAQAERERKIRAGARFVPFGFSRALDDDDAAEAAWPPEPLTWDGDYA